MDGSWLRGWLQAPWMALWMAPGSMGSSMNGFRLRGWLSEWFQDPWMAPGCSALTASPAAQITQSSEQAALSPIRQAARAGMCFGAYRTFAGLEAEAADWIRRCFTWGQHRRRGQSRGGVTEGGRGAEGSASRAGGVTKAVAESRCESFPTGWASSSSQCLGCRGSLSKGSCKP